MSHSKQKSPLTSENAYENTQRYVEKHAPNLLQDLPPEVQKALIVGVSLLRLAAQEKYKKVGEEKIDVFIRKALSLHATGEINIATGMQNPDLTAALFDRINASYGYQFSHNYGAHQSPLNKVMGNADIRGMSSGLDLD